MFSERESLPKLADICTVAPNKSACLFFSFFGASQHRCLYLRFLFLLIRHVQCSVPRQLAFGNLCQQLRISLATALVINEKRPQQAVQASPAGVTQHKEAQAWPTRQPASKTRRRRSSPGKEMRKRPTKAEAFICVPLKKFVITYRPLKS